jgi:hypothetical protein
MKAPGEAEELTGNVGVKGASAESSFGPDPVLEASETLRRAASVVDDSASPRPKPSRTSPRTRRFLPLALAAVALALVALNPPSLERLASAAKAIRAAHPTQAGRQHVLGDQAGLLPGTLIEFMENSSSTRTLLEGGNALDTATALDAGALPEGAAAGAAAPADTTGQMPPDSGTTSRAPAAAPKVVRSMGYIEVFVEPPAEILIDGERRFTGDHLAMIEIETGRHRLVCRSAGYHDYVESLYVQRGELSRRTIYLEEITGAIFLESAAGAQLFIDGAHMGTTPLAAPIEIAPGSHSVRLAKTGYAPWQGVVYVPADETVRFTIELLPRSFSQ